MKSTASANETDYLFLELFDRYVRRIADRYDMPELTANAKVLNKVDLSTLSAVDQKGFETWLDNNFYMRISIENALRRGMSVKALMAKNTATSKVEYSVRIEG